MHDFTNGVYRGFRYDGKGRRDLFGDYTIVVAEPAKDGTPRVSVNGKRAAKVFAHSNGHDPVTNKVDIEAACCVYAPGYDKRYLCDHVTISADPKFLVKQK